MPIVFFFIRACENNLCGGKNVLKLYKCYKNYQQFSCTDSVRSVCQGFMQFKNNILKNLITLQNLVKSVHFIKFLFYIL
jgi:hypothetical protein